MRTHSDRLMRVALVMAMAMVAAPAVVAAQAATPAQATTPAPPAAMAASPASPTVPGETLTGSGPNGATMRCRDGSYPAPLAPDSACEGKGGILVRFPVLRRPAPRPAVKVTPAPALPGDEAASTAPSVETPTASRANIVIPAPRVPDGATMQCRDGSFVVADTSATRCSARGGVHVRFPQRVRPR